MTLLVPNLIRSVSAAMVVASCPPFDLPDLSLRLMAGDKWSVTSKQSFCEAGSTQVIEGFTYRTTSLVKRIGKDGYQVEASTELLESRVGDTVVPPAKGAKPLVQQMALGRNGEAATQTNQLDDPIEFRIARIAWFLAPDAGKPLTSEPDAWEAALPGNEGGSVPAARATFRVLKIAEHGGRKAAWIGIGFSESETDRPIRAKGAVFVDLATGLLLGGRIDATGVPMPGGDGTRYEMAIELTTKLELKNR